MWIGCVGELHLRMNSVKVYTDGSCHPQLKVGAWVAIIVAEEELSLTGTASLATNNQMELVAAIQAIQYLQAHYSKKVSIRIHLDSQYVFRLPERAEKLYHNAFRTKKGKAIPNQKYVQIFLELYAQGNIDLVKLKAHQKKELANPYHRKADLLSRRLLRKKVEDFSKKEEK